MADVVVRCAAVAAAAAVTVTAAAAVTVVAFAARAAAHPVCSAGIAVPAAGQARLAVPALAPGSGPVGPIYTACACPGPAYPRSGRRRARAAVDASRAVPDVCRAAMDLSRGVPDVSHGTPAFSAAVERGTHHLAPARAVLEPIARARAG